MKKALILLTGLIISIQSFSRHPVESLSVGEMTYNENGISIKIKCLEEGLRSSLIYFTNKNIVFDYDDVVLNKELLRVIEVYFRTHLKVTVNDKLLTMKLKRAFWVEGTQASDHAALKVEVYFPSVKLKDIKTISIKNSLLMSVEEQTNILNISLAEHSEVFTFQRGKEHKSFILK